MAAHLRIVRRAVRPFMQCRAGGAADWMLVVTVLNRPSMKVALQGTTYPGLVPESGRQTTSRSSARGLSSTGNPPYSIWSYSRGGIGVGRGTLRPGAGEKPSARPPAGLQSGVWWWTSLKVS
jgi:hypothetical protein